MTPLYEEMVSVLCWARESGNALAYEWIADRFAIADWSEGGEYKNADHTHWCPVNCTSCDDCVSQLGCTCKPQIPKETTAVAELTVTPAEPPVRTFWNYEPLDPPARMCHVVVADSPRFPSYWAREAQLIGDTVSAVEVTHGGKTFYLFEADGTGWHKVTKGRGSPRYPHKNLEIEEVVRYL